MSKRVDFDEAMLLIRSALAHMWHTARDATSPSPAYDRADSLIVIDDRMDEVSISLNHVEDLVRELLLGDDEPTSLPEGNAGSLERDDA